MLADLCSCLRDYHTIGDPFGLDPLPETRLTRESKKFEMMRGNSLLFSL